MHQSGARMRLFSSTEKPKVTFIYYYRAAIVTSWSCDYVDNSWSRSKGCFWQDRSAIHCNSFAVRTVHTELCAARWVRVPWLRASSSLTKPSQDMPLGPLTGGFAFRNCLQADIMCCLKIYGLCIAFKSMRADFVQCRKTEKD